LSFPFSDRRSVSGFGIGALDRNCGQAVFLGAGPRGTECENCRSLAPLQSLTDSQVISPTAMAGGNAGLVLCQVSVASGSLQCQGGAIERALVAESGQHHMTRRSVPAPQCATARAGCFKAALARA